MQSAARNWLMLLAIVLGGAVAHTSLPARRLLPTTKILSGFPSRIGPYSVQQDEFPDSDATRRVYAPAAIVYRDYAQADGDPINLFIAPEPVGWDTPAICTTYRGSVVTKMSVESVPSVPGLLLNEIVTRGDNPQDPMSLCAYYWRTPGGSANDHGLTLVKGKLDALAGRSAFRVEMCTEVRDVSDINSASGRIFEFAAVVDPEVRRSLQEAIETAK